MNIESTNVMDYSQTNKSSHTQENGNNKINATKISNHYLMKYQVNISSFSFEQTSKQVETLSLADIGYNGKAIGDLTQNEAKDLVSKDGFFGIDKTSQRLIDFVLNGAGDDVEKLQAGRAGMLQGFKEAEKLWGGKLPEISYTTMNKTIEALDAKINELGGKILDSSI